MHKILSLLLLINFFNLNSMHIKNCAAQITFNNETKSIGHWIKLCIINPSHPFARTKVYRYYNNYFVEKGNLLSLNKKDIFTISTGKALFCTNYELLKTEHHGDSFEEIGVLLVGTNTVKALNIFYQKNGVDLRQSIKLQSKL